ncbi:MAG TPA: NUDIX hydrolase [Segeticoccus sp.]|uniref:NUDIX hydrolase n=1 Tax=Segeticoccus sp. TaxID=2706531 RepID=UPI002D80CF63|nr:NUDIX hydrolase [Segeticoccus sp.]HET8600620.1 NUDIX hydrolase [Segeticoccus sp.]
MSLQAPLAADGEIVDRIDPRPVRSRRTVYEGAIWDVVQDRVDLGEAGEVTRDYVDHTGAVSIIALRQRDGRDEILLICQYRHPVGVFEWEPPAGLLDQDGEQPWEAAARELHEEADLTAGRWQVLVDYFSSPGGMSEALRVYLATDLADVPEAERHTRSAEEHGMPARWVRLDDARDAVLAGRLHNPSAVIGILAAHAAREQGWETLRPVDAPWPWHPDHR